MIRLVVHNYSIHISLCPLSSRCRPRHSKGLRVSKILPTSGRSKTVRRSRQTSKFRAKRWKPVCNSSRWEDSCGLRDLENKEMQRALHGHYMIYMSVHGTPIHTYPHLSQHLARLVTAWTYLEDLEALRGDTNRISPVKVSVAGAEPLHC